MSRGLGRSQRRVVAALSADERVLEEGLPLQALRPFHPRDRSNRRRVIQSLISRGDVEVVDDPETGEQHIRLRWMAGLKALMNLRHPYDEDEDY